MRRRSELAGFCALGIAHLMMVAGAPGAHAEHHYFRLYTAADGLSQAVVQAVYQDRAGHLWIGTQAGLNRYDGTSMTTYGVRQGLANDWINAIAEDYKGRIWLATLNGASVWDGERFVNYTIADGLADNRVVSLVVGPDDSVWCATPRGVCRYDGRRWRVFTPADGLPADSANAVLVGHTGRLWAATTRGLAYFEREHFVPFDSPSLLGRNIRALCEDSEHQLWLGLDESLRLYKGERLAKVYTRANGLDYGPVVALCTDRFGIIWLGTPKGLGVLRDGQITFLNADKGLAYNDVRALLEDREGVLWIGVYGGLYKFQGRAFTNYDASDGLGSNSVRPVLRDRKGFLWVGTTGGLSRFEDHRWRNFTVADGLADSTIDSLLEDHDGTLWIGTRTGLTVYDGARFNKGIAPAVHGRVMSIVEDHAGTVWCAGQLGALYRRVEGQFEPVPVDGQSFSDSRLFVDRRGWVWASGDNGLSRWDGRTWRTYTMKDGLASNQPYYLCSDQTGRIWFGYHSSNGLSRFDGTRFAHYTTTEGLANDAVYSLGVDKRGNLWVGTARGVDRFDGQAFTHFGTEEGYANEESNAGGFFADLDGTLWFGTLGGLSHYDPRFDLSGGGAPKVELTEIRLGKREFSPVESPGVGYQIKELFARVAGLSFANEKQLSFQYRLLGLSEDWLPFQGHEIRVTNLSPQRYILEVRTRKYQGPWSEPAQFSFTIDGPFWITAWFRALVLISVCSVILAVHWLVTRAIRQRNRLLETKVSERTAALQLAKEQAQRRAAQASLLYEIGQRVSSKLNLDILLSEIVNTVREAFDYYGVTIMLREGGEVLRLKAIAGAYADAVPEALMIEIGTGMVGMAAKTGTTQLSGDVSKNVHYVNVASETTRSELSVPLKSGDGVIGVLDIQSSDYSAFSDFDVVAIEALSSQIVIAITNARLYARAQQELLERRQAEEALRERSRELALKTEELESFIYTISHDLKAPVISLQGMANLLKLDLGDQINGDAALYLERIHANTVHMQRLINQLLNLSRIGRLREPQAPVDLGELAREAVRDLEGQIKLKRATITIAEDLPVITCEHDRLKQVMANLIANAIHYSRPDTPPVIEIGVQKENGRPGFCTLFVRDNGIGIAKEYHERIFEIFYRVDGKYADSDSTGVGLAIVKRIIGAHGGNAWVESEGLGSGSAFYFSLPREKLQNA